MARGIGLGLIAGAAIAVFFFLGPAEVADSNYDDLIDTAMSDNEANDAAAESAPQQQVVNGWVARDLLLIQAMMMSDLLELQVADQRIPALLVLGILALVVIGLTPSPRATVKATSATTSRVVPSSDPGLSDSGLK